VADGSLNLRLATIVSVDVFGFARESDEDRQKIALAYEALVARLEGAAERHDGRLFASDQDGYMVEFPNAPTAVAAAEEIATGPWPPVRVGVHQGHVTALPGGDLVGDAVATATHVEQVADRGAVLVSEEVRRALQGSPLARRLVRVERPAKAEGTGEAIPVYRLEFIPVVDTAAQRKRLQRIAMSTAAVVVGFGVVVWAFFGRDIVTTLNPRHDHVAVLRLRAAGTDKDAADFAASLTDEIAYVLKQGDVPLAFGPEAEKLRAPDRGSWVRRLQVGAVLDGAVAGGGGNPLDVKLNIDDPVHHRSVWTHEFTGVGDDLKTQAASRVIGVLTCSARALRPGAKVVDPGILTLYLKFCDLDADAAADAAALAEEERILRQLTTTAPQFSDGHSKLALFLTSKSEVDPANAQALRQEAKAEADRALALDAKNSDGYVARARLLPAPEWVQREKNLATALSLPAAGPDPQVVYAQMLPEVGRLKDAAAHAQKGATLLPWDADALAFSALLFSQSGRTDDAGLALTKSLQMAPANPVVQTFRFHMYEWLGRWDDALNILNDEATRPPQVAQEDDLGATRLFLAAMKTEDGPAKAAARAAELASVQKDRSHLMAAISRLSALGFVDDAFRLAQQYPPSAGSDDLSTLFTPLVAPMRQDPGFMALAAQLGLVDYWKAARRWPDFCADAELPYRCASEAAKYAAK
jgi:class 3 adenylate cyclase/tetratricopeptide (TPR) repeat protein